MAGTISRTRVAIIGAGSSGLAQLKQLLDAFSRPNVRSELQVVVYEGKNDVGGVWLRENEEKKKYKRVSGRDGQMYFLPVEGERGLSPMYDGLRTNLPYDLMSYRDFPMKSDSLFPDQQGVEQYLKDYATKFDLNRHIRFQTIVTRLRLNPAAGPQQESDGRSSPRRWLIESRSTDGTFEEEFDYVCVANGHYADCWIPLIPALDTFPGELLHSRFYRRPEDYEGQTVMVVGSFASGSDLSRQLAGLNVTEDPATPDEPDAPSRTRTETRTRVYLSSSGGPSNYSLPPGPGDPPQPWRKYIINQPLISHLSPPTPDRPKGVIHFQDGTQVDDVDVLIFATGYNFSLEFCKVSDLPWSDRPPLEDTIEGSEQGGTGPGIKGLAMAELDELLLFRDGDRSISFPTLAYQVVPFPLAETQARLTAFLWSGLISSLPPHLRLPPNPTNPYHTPPATPPDSDDQDQRSPLPPPHKPSTDPPADEPKPVRKVVQYRKKLVFGSPFEWDYEEYLMSLMRAVDGEDTPECWKRIEDWRRARRADTALRRKTLGY